MKILAIGAHPDDIEMGLSGTLFKYSQSKAESEICVLSLCEDELPLNWPKDTLKTECEAAMNGLGVQKVSFRNFPNKFLESYRQDVLKLFYSLAINNYDLVFCPSSFNSNQDHITAYNETRRAFRSTSILGYQTPSSDYGFSPSAIYSILKEDAVGAKIEALACYKSQYELKRPYFGAQFTTSLMRVAGMEIWKDYAEKFEPIRYVL